MKVLNNNQHLQCELRTVYVQGQPDHVNYQLPQGRHSIDNDSDEKSQYRTRYRIEVKKQYRLRGPLSCFDFHSRGIFKRFENCTVKLSAKEKKWTSSEVRTRPVLETLISNLIPGR